MITKRKRLLFWKFIRRRLRITETEEPFDPENGQTTYLSPLWSLARAVKHRHPSWTEDHAWDRVNEAVTMHLGGWLAWDIKGMLSLDELEGDFINSYLKCRMPSSDPLQAALRKAEESQFIGVLLKGTDGYIKFVKTMACLPIVLNSDQFRALPFQS